MRTSKMVLVLLMGTSSVAQAATGDPVRDHLFPPDMVMRHQREIGLTEAQRQTLKAETKAVQDRFLELRWKIQEEAEHLEVLVQANPIDEVKVVSQADKLMALEREVKTIQLVLLVRVRNTLTPVQIEQLKKLSPAAGPPPFPGAPPLPPAPPGH